MTLRHALAAWSGMLAGLARASAWTGVGLFFAVAVLSVCEILARWIAGISFMGVSDLAAIGTVLGVSACFPHCAVVRGHLSLKLLQTSNLPPFARALLDLLGIVLTALAFFLIARQLWIYGAELGRAGNVSLMLQIPMGPVWRAAAALLMTAALVEIDAAIQRLLPVEAAAPAALRTPS